MTFTVAGMKQSSMRIITLSILTRSKKIFYIFYNAFHFNILYVVQ